MPDDNLNAIGFARSFNAPPTAIPKQKKSLLRFLKINRIFTSVFYTVFFWKKRYSLQTKDILLVKHAAYRFKNETNKKNSNKTPPSAPSPGISLPFINLDQPKNFDVQASDEFDSSLKAMQTFFGSFATHIFECLYEKHAQDKVEKLNKVLQVSPNKLKKIAKFLLQVNKNSKPIFQLLEEKTNPLIEHVFQWLIDGANKESILTALKSRLKIVDLPAGVNLEEQYVHPLLNWCFGNNHKEDALDNKKSNQGIADAVLEEIILILFECKIETYFTLINTTLGEQKLPNLLLDTLSKNVKKSTDIVTDQLSNLIHHADYSANFGVAEEAFSQHIDALLTGKMAIGETEKGTNKTTAFWKEFAKQKACHPVIQQMIKALSEESLDLAQSHEMKYLSSVAEKLLTLVCPPYVTYTKEGFIVERDGLGFLWDQFVISPEFVFLIKKGLQVVQEIVSPEMMPAIENAQKYANSFFEAIIIDYANKLAKKQIIVRLKDFIDRITHPKRRDELMALHILPQISRLILYAYIRIILSDNIKSIAELFEKLGNVDSFSENRLLAIKEKFRALINSTFNGTLNILLQDYEIGKAQFDTEFDQIIEDIRKSWKLCPDNTALDCLTKYFSSPDVKKNEIYGNLIIKIVFEIGKLNSITKSFAPYVKDNISMRIAKTLHSVTSSHQKTISAIIEASSQAYGTKEKVQELLFDQPKLLSDTKREKKLQKELNLISLLSHKFISYSAKSMGFLVPAEAEINKVIQNIYYGILGDPLIFKSITYRIQDIALEAFTKARDIIQQKKDMLEAKKINATIPEQEDNLKKDMA